VCVLFGTVDSQYSTSVSYACYCVNTYANIVVLLIAVATVLGSVMSFMIANLHYSTRCAEACAGTVTTSNEHFTKHTEEQGPVRTQGAQAHLVLGID
jgi:chloramphenicol O-acetyltransferase